MSASAIVTPTTWFKRSPADDSSLLGQVCEGDAGAIGQLFDRHATLVYSVALQILQGSELAEDVLHYVFMQLWREPTCFLGFDLGGSLALLARNQAIDRLLHRRAGERGVPAVLISHQRATPRMKLLETCFRVPSIKMQEEVLRMAFFEGQTLEAIAKQFGETPETIKTQMRKGLKQDILTRTPLLGGRSDG